MFIIFRGIQHYIFHLSLCKTLVLVFFIRRNDQRVFLHRSCFKKTFLLKKNCLVKLPLHGLLQLGRLSKAVEQLQLFFLLRLQSQGTARTTSNLLIKNVPKFCFLSLNRCVCSMHINLCIEVTLLDYVVLLKSPV